jgi:transposase-like protein
MANSPTEEGANVVACLTCGSENTVQTGVRGPTYQCQDCNGDFGLDGGPME